MSKKNNKKAGNVSQQDAETIENNLSEGAETHYAEVVEETDKTIGAGIIKKPIVKKEIYNFDYHFTREELEEKAKHLAKACEERNALEDEKKSITSEYKAKIDGKNAEVNIISKHVTTGKE